MIITVLLSLNPGNWISKSDIKSLLPTLFCLCVKLEKVWKRSWLMETQRYHVMNCNAVFTMPTVSLFIKLQSCFKLNFNEQHSGFIRIQWIHTPGIIRLYAVKYFIFYKNHFVHKASITATGFWHVWGIHCSQWI